MSLDRAPVWSVRCAESAYAPRAMTRRDDMELGQAAVLVAGWVVAFMLGKELQAGFAQWKDASRGK